MANRQNRDVVQLTINAKKRMALTAAEDPFDRKRHLLPFTNGVMDLRTRNFRPIRKDDYVRHGAGRLRNVEQRNAAASRGALSPLPYPTLVARRNVRGGLASRKQGRGGPRGGLDTPRPRGHGERSRSWQRRRWRSAALPRFR